MNSSISPVQRYRDETLDIMKGLGLILVVLAHYHDFPEFFAFTFLMPMFFILAGFLYKPRDVKNAVKKDFKRLLLPFLIVIGCIVFIGIIKDFITGEDVFFNAKCRLVYSLWPNGFYLFPKEDGYFYIPLIVWFLSALFWCKTAYNILEKVCKGKWLLCISILVSFAFILLTRHTRNYTAPLDLYEGFGAITFFAIGHWIRLNFYKYKKILLAFFIFSSIVWLFYVLKSQDRLYIGMNANSYGFYPRDIVMAIGGTFLIWVFCRFLVKKIPLIRQLLVFCGINSLLFLCVHCIEYNYQIMEFLGFEHGVVYTIIDLLICILFTYSLILIKRNGRLVFSPRVRSAA